MHFKNGVLQGGVLSPMIFNLYLDDLIQYLEDRGFKCFAFADDLGIRCRSVRETVKVLKIVQ